jgi:hypothetical protein
MLTLPIKKKWFDMIESGEKKEEYRDIKPYYQSRFDKYLEKHIPVKFRNGYSNDSPSCICMVFVTIGTGKPEWGAVDGVLYYVLSICKE